VCDNNKWGCLLPNQHATPSWDGLLNQCGEPNLINNLAKSVSDTLTAMVLLKIKSDTLNGDGLL
jgi:hypothetical protein